MTVLVKFEAARHALAEARSIDEVPLDGHVLLSNRKNLPKVSGVYIVFSANDILYVGRATDIHKRWQGHHRKQQLDKLPNDIFIGWLEMPHVLAVSREEDYIELLSPRFNGKDIPRCTKEPDEHFEYFIDWFLMKARPETLFTEFLDQIIERLS